MSKELQIATKYLATVRPSSPEYQQQIAVMGWMAECGLNNIEYRMAFHIPNGGSRTKSEASRFKLEGVKAGVPDIFIPVPKGKFSGLFVEMKKYSQRPKSEPFCPITNKGALGGLSNEQKQWAVDLTYMGYKWVCAYGASEAIEEIYNYLNQTKKGK